jgi:cytochrome bd-type quinol oxidase subunit 2
MEFLARFGLLIAAGVLLWLAKRLHSKGRGKAQKNAAGAGAFAAGLLFIGTLFGGWMAKLTGASPWIALAVFLFAVGAFLVDVWTDKQVDRLAFWCLLIIPMAIVFGAAQLPRLGDELQKRGEQVSAEIEQAGN